MPLNLSLTFAFRDVTILGRARFRLRIRLMIHESSYLDSTLLVNPSLRQPIGCLIQEIKQKFIQTLVTILGPVLAPDPDFCFL